MRLAVQTIFQVLLLLLMKKLEVLEAVFVLCFDLLHFNHVSETSLIYLTLHLRYLVLIPHLSHCFKLLPLRDRHLVLLLELFALNLPGKQLLGFVQQQAFDLELNLFHLRVLLIHSFVVLMVPITHVFLQSPPELFELRNLILVGLSL